MPPKARTCDPETTAPVNAAPVEAILKACELPAQLGGGIRDMATIESWLDKGLARVILGTVAVENPDLVREAARAFPGRVAVGINARFRCYKYAPGMRLMSRLSGVSLT